MALITLCFHTHCLIALRESCKDLILYEDANELTNLCLIDTDIKQNTQPFNGPWSGTTRVGRYQKKHSPTHTHPDHRTSFINFFHLLQYIASSVFSLRA